MIDLLHDNTSSIQDDKGTEQQRDAHPPYSPDLSLFRILSERKVTLIMSIVFFKFNPLTVIRTRSQCPTTYGKRWRLYYELKLLINKNDFRFENILLVSVIGTWWNILVLQKLNTILVPFHRLPVGNKSVIQHTTPRDTLHFWFGKWPNLDGLIIFAQNSIHVTTPLRRALWNLTQSKIYFS